MMIVEDNERGTPHNERKFSIFAVDVHDLFYSASNPLYQRLLHRDILDIPRNPLLMREHPTDLTLVWETIVAHDVRPDPRNVPARLFIRSECFESCEH
jgi:hypothetical protein